MNQIVKTHEPPMRNFRRDEEAVRELSPEQFRVTQRSGTERPLRRTILRLRCESAHVRAQACDHEREIAAHARAARGVSRCG